MLPEGTGESHREGGKVIYDSWPAMNICLTEKNCIITCEIAGMNEDDFQVFIEGNDLRIAGERPEPAVPEKAIYHRYEIKHGSFGRNYWVPSVDCRGEKAVYQNGFLKVVIPLDEAAGLTGMGKGFGLGFSDITFLA